MSLRPFVDTLRDIDYGSLLDECSAAQQELVAAVNRTGKQGEITIKLKYKPETGGQIHLEHDVVVKAPKEKKAKTIFFATPENNLSRTDPRQGELSGLRSVEADKTQAREVKHA